MELRNLEGDVQERISRFLFRYRVTPHSTTGLSPAELLMGQRLRNHLDLLHPDTSRKVIEKQDKLAKVTKRCRKFAVGDRLYARNYRGNNKWIPVIVTRFLGPVSYQVQTSSGSIQRRHVDQLRYRHSLDSNDDWPFSCTSSPEQGHRRLEVASSTTTSLRLAFFMHFKPRTRSSLVGSCIIYHHLSSTF